MSQTEKEILWAEIERDYRTGAFSNRALARRYNVPESTLRGRANRGKWPRDLRSRLKDEVRTRLIAQNGVDPTRVDDLVEEQVDEILDDQTVKRAAQRVIDVISAHRSATEDAFVGIRAVQKALNRLLKDAENKELPPDQLRLLAQAQRQNAHSLSNIISCDRKSYDMDDAISDDAPDSINITFFRDRDDIDLG